MSPRTRRPSRPQAMFKGFKADSGNPISLYIYIYILVFNKFY